MVQRLLSTREMKRHNKKIIIISETDSMTSVQHKIKSFERFVWILFLSVAESGTMAMGRRFQYTMI